MKAMRGIAWMAVVAVLVLAGCGGGGQATKGGEGRGRLLVHGLCYLLGLALTNSLLGVVASLTGGLETRRVPAVRGLG